MALWPVTTTPRAARVATITGTETLSGLYTLDGISLVDGDRVLVQGTAGLVDGIFIARSGAWTAAPDFATTAQKVAGVIVSVRQGDINAGSLWVYEGGQFESGNIIFADEGSFTGRVKAVNFTGTGVLATLTTGVLNVAIPGQSSTYIQPNSTSIGLTVKRFSAGTTTDLQLWQDETGATVASVNYEGAVYTARGQWNSGVRFGQVEFLLTGGDSGSKFKVYNIGAGKDHFSSYADRFEMPAVVAGAVNPVSGVSALKIYGRTTTSGAPTSGTWAVGDMITDIEGTDFLCTAAGTPGTWTWAQGWHLIGSSRLTSAAAATGAVTVPAAEELMIVVRIISLSASDIVALQFNGDTGNNYWSRYITSVAGGVVMVNNQTATTNMARLHGVAATTTRIATCFINNRTAASKVAKCEPQVGTGAAGTGGGLDVAGAFEWVNTTAQITSVTLRTVGGTATMAVDSGFQVYGRNF